MSRASFTAWWQLLRAGNVFTAASNIIAGFVIAEGGRESVAALPVLILASALLYEAGMVLNDVFDAELDAQERPERPLPSGRIAAGTATRVGWGLLIAGVAAAGWASSIVGHAVPLQVGVALALCIVGYDAGLKNTPLGPWVMGSCRLLNVLLGASVVAEFWTTAVRWHALGIGLYTVGLTYFSKSENDAGWKFSNTLGTVIVAATTLSLCVWLGQSAGNLLLAAIVVVALNGFFWIGLNWLGSGLVEALILRSTVGRLIVGFIMLDALAVYAFSDLGSALIVLSLLVPTWIASRFAPMT